eukprot:m.50371 g.50371  ORF g.50371 m.50371 type:complete len:118 (+) comp15132_c1_seq1:331-684(+)
MTLCTELVQSQPRQHWTSSTPSSTADVTARSLLDGGSLLAEELAPSFVFHRGLALEPLFCALAVMCAHAVPRHLFAGSSLPKHKHKESANSSTIFYRCSRREVWAVHKKTSRCGACR